LLFFHVLTHLTHATIAATLASTFAATVASTVASTVAATLAAALAATLVANFAATAATTLAASYCCSSCCNSCCNFVAIVNASLFFHYKIHFMMNGRILEGLLRFEFFGYLFFHSKGFSRLDTLTLF
jgi:hypothetical protein